MQVIIGIDPGPEQSGYALVRQDYTVVSAGKSPNREVRSLILSFARPQTNPPIICIEAIQSYKMRVGRSVFETCFWIGRYVECAERGNLPCHLYARPKVFRAIVGASEGGDTALRAALLTRFGGDRKGEPLNMLKGDTDRRSAYAVAVYHLDGAALGEW